MPECRILAADLVEPRDVRSRMLPGRSQSQALISYFSSRDIPPCPARRRLAQLEAAIDAPERRSVAASTARMLEAGATAGLQEHRVDVRRVDEEVRPHVLARLVLGELGQVLGELGLGVAPGEVAVGLGEADLGQPLHHLGPGERLGQEDRRRDARSWTSRIIHSQNGSGLVCGLSTRKIFTPLLDPEQHDVAQRQPERRARRPRRRSRR